MDTRFRAAFNRAYTQELYERYRTEVRDLVGFDPGFRLAETPVFVPPELLEKLRIAGDELIRQAGQPTVVDRLDRVVPDRFCTPGRDATPGMATVDFAIVEVDGELEPRLIELQGFPSLYAFEVFQHDAWTTAISSMEGLDLEWSCWPAPFDRESFLDAARKTILGDHNPDEVFLIDIDPEAQKTRCDFAATHSLFGVETVDAMSLVSRGRELFVRTEGGGERRAHRIYNRVISDELVSRGAELPVDFREELDVEWVCHPDWYFIWSKATLPFLDHETVPRVRLVSELESTPDDLTSGWVLKPLFSFAGVGVEIEPEQRHLDSIPDSDRHLWCLQRKVEYAPVIKAPDGGGVKAEIRLMYIRPEPDGELVLAENLVRLARGKMHGVDHNRDFTWVGSSVGLWPGEE